MSPMQPPDDPDTDDTFELYDLEVRIEAIGGRCTCDHQVGERFALRGGKLHLPPGQGFCLYALQAAIPLLPAKQRPTHPNDWMSTDARIVCPDPACGVVLLIERTQRRVLHHADVSAVPLDGLQTPPQTGVEGVADAVADEIEGHDQ